MHFSVDRPSPGYCRITFEHPRINTITAATVAELAEQAQFARLEALGLNTDSDFERFLGRRAVETIFDA